MELNENFKVQHTSSQGITEKQVDENFKAQHNPQLKLFHVLMQSITLILFFYPLSFGLTLHDII